MLIMLAGVVLIVVDRPAGAGDQDESDAGVVIESIVECVNVGNADETRLTSDQ